MENYIKEVLRFEPDTEQYQEVLTRIQNPEMLRIFHGLLGMTTEVGELFDQFKKHVFYGKEIDLVNLAEEIGDSDWYRGITVNAIANLLERDAVELDSYIKEKNIAKLDKRYKKGKFDAENAINRDLTGEREVLES